MVRHWLLTVALTGAALLLTPRTTFAQCDAPLLVHCSDVLVVRFHLQAGVNAVFEENMFWNLGAALAPEADFDADAPWLEGYVLPGFSVARSIGGRLITYGKVSSVISGTRGIDAFASGNTGRITLEEGYAGLRSRRRDARRWFDLSVGPREFAAGTGMLLQNGGASGFARGSLKLGPHRAWGFAALGRAGIGPVSGTAFYLDPNELPDNDTGTKIVGGDLRTDSESGSFAGITVGRVVASRAPYPKAAPNGIGVPSILPNARDGLNFVTLYTRARPLPRAMPQLSVSVDAAFERNGAIDLRAWAARGQASYTFASVALQPTLSYTYQTFSGDDPATTRLERFDPLYYEGSPSAWATGSKSAMVFINSNVHAHQASLRLTPTKQDTITFRYAHISANKLLSPIQFGQATRVEESSGVVNPIAGVIHPHLSDDTFVEYIRALNAHIYITSGLSVSIPGQGIDSIVELHAPLWTGGFINVVINF